MEAPGPRNRGAVSLDAIQALRSPAVWKEEKPFEGKKRWKADGRRQKGFIPVSV